MSGSRRGARASILVTLVASITVLVWPVAPAGAHAVVVATSPGPRALLTEPPAEVTVTFNEPVNAEADSIVVIDAQGAVVSGETTTTGTTMSAPVDPTTTGWHAVSWWGVSADGHPVSGAWTFRIGDGDDTAPEGLEEQAAAAATPSTAWRWSFALSQWAATLAAVVATGTAFAMLALGHPRALEPLALGTTAVGAVLSLATAAINGPYSAVSLSWFEGPASGHHLGRAALLALATLVLVGTRPRAGDDTPGSWAPIRLVTVVLAGAALCLPVLVGHTRTSGTAATVGVMSHLVVGGAWLGAIPAVLVLVRSGTPVKPLLSTFSRAATWLLALTLVAGTASAAILSGGPGNMARAWGFTLFVKVSLVGVAVTAGLWSRWNIVPHADDLPRRRTSSPLVVEAVALVLVVAASVALTHNGPPRAEPATSTGPVIIDEVVDDVRLQLIIDPARVGPNDVHLFVLDATGLPLPAEEATTTFSSDELGVGRIEQSLTHLGAGHYSGSTDDLGLEGTWEAHVVVRPDRFSQVELTQAFEVRR